MQMKSQCTFSSADVPCSKIQDSNLTHKLQLTNLTAAHNLKTFPSCAL